MPISMYQASVPPLVRSLNNLVAILKKVQPMRKSKRLNQRSDQQPTLSRYVSAGAAGANRF